MSTYNALIIIVTPCYYVWLSERSSEYSHYSVS